MRKKGDAARAAIAAQKFLQDIREKSRISILTADREHPQRRRPMPGSLLTKAELLVTEFYGLIRQKRPGVEIGLEAMRGASQTITESLDALIPAAQIETDKTPNTDAARAVQRLAILAAEFDYFLQQCRRKAEKDGT
jgi:hypothetical protein